MSKLEAELAAVRADLAGDHAGDWQKLHTLADRERELDALLARRIAEWEAASAAALNPDREFFRLTIWKPWTTRSCEPAVGRWFHRRSIASLSLGPTLIV